MREAVSCATNLLLLPCDEDGTGRTFGPEWQGIMAFAKVTAAEFNALLKQNGSARFQRELARYDFFVPQGDCAVHRGSLSVPGALPASAANMLVLGDLSADGLLDLGEDGAECGCFIVLGNVACSAFANAYGKCVMIDGNLEADEIIVNSFEDSALTVTGHLRTYFYHGIDIWAEVGGRAEMEYGDGYCLPIGYTAAAAEAIEPRHDRDASLRRLSFGNGASVDPQDFLDRLKNGQPIFRPLM
ncbi:hypothetical protein AB7M17_000744 [Bradyrhizobium sp. USDA 377]